MFRPQRRKNKVLDEEIAVSLLVNERRGILAVNGDDGYPYAVPVNYLYDREVNKIYIHGAYAGHKADSIRKSDKVCFTVYGNEQIREEAWAPYMQSVVIFGRCRILNDREETLALVKRLAMKYYPEEAIADKEIATSGKAVQIYEITVEHLSGKEIQER